MNQRTPLYEVHLQLGARMVPFAGWEMPVQYSSVLDEHHAVRRHAGVFDVSHMTRREVDDATAGPLLRRLFANDLERLAPGQAMYTAMLDEQGGILDDVIVYAPLATAPHLWRIVVNSATHDKDIAWLPQHLPTLSVRERRDLAMLAIQGPAARAILADLLPAAAPVLRDLAPFHGDVVADADAFIARTGYTGEDGVEIMLPAAQAVGLLPRLVAAGVQACGLAARDTLRLEAGMNLYGSDMGEQDTPLTSNMAWTVRFEHDFIGRAALLAQQQAGLGEALTGLLLEERGVLRAHMPVHLPDGRRGETTSGSFSPTLERSIALARLPLPLPETVEVEVRGRRLRARVVPPPFVRQGQARY